MESLKQTTVKSIIWTGLERISVQGIQFIVSMIVARILSPTDYGLVAMVTIFISISDAIITSGFGMALIRKKDVNDKDYATAFTFNIIAAVLLYFLLYITAPYIAEFYHNKQITSILRVLALSLIINSFSIVQNTQLLKNLKFKFAANISIVSSLTSGLSSIIFATLGFGVWTIVFQSLIYNVLNSLLLYYYIRWKPRILFCKESFRYLIGFGINIQFTNILNSIYNNIYNLVIGRFYNPTELGLFSRGNSISVLIPYLFTGVFSKTSLPILSKIQDDEEQLQRALCKLISTASFFIFPIMGLLYVLAPPFILLVLGEKWVECIIYIQLFAITTCLTPISSLNQAIPLVKGRSDYTFRIELLKKITSIIGILILIPFGIIPLAIFASAWNIVIYIIDMYCTYRLIHLKPIIQMKSSISSILSSISMVLIVRFIINFFNDNIVKLIIGGSTGFILYFLINKYIVKSNILKEIQNYYEGSFHKYRF